MAKRARMKKSGKSPYQKYSKQPFAYQHSRCAHKNSHYEQVPDWRGMVCDVCNIITDGPFDKKENRQAA